MESERDDEPSPPSGEWIALRSVGILIFVFLVMLAGGLAEGPCRFPQLRSWCEPIPLEQTSVERTKVAQWEAGIERRVAELAPPRDPKRARPPVVVWHRPPRDDPKVETIVVALRAAGYEVKEARSDLDNLIGLSGSPGDVYVRSSRESLNSDDIEAENVHRVLRKSWMKGDPGAVQISSWPGMPFDRNEVQVLVY